MIVVAICVPLDNWEIINLDSEQANNVEEANEIEQMKTVMNNQEEEIKLLRDEINQLKGMLKREVNQAENDKKTNLTIIQDYEVSRRHMDNKLQAVKKELEILKV